MAVKIENGIWRWTKMIAPIFLGAAGGYAYYHFVGCASGTCAITSNPWMSTAYGALVGSLMMPRRKVPAKLDDKLETGGAGSSGQQ
jgi:hypothetical protein